MRTDEPSPSGVGVIPYCEIDGVRTFKDSEIMEFYDRMVEDGIAPIVFHAGDVRSPIDFLKKMKGSGTALYIVFYGDDPVGLIWLTHFEAKTCRVHFASFSEVWDQDTVGIGKEAINQVLYMTVSPESDDFVFDVLLGLIPSRNVRAIKWLNKVGLTVAGEIPNALWDAEENQSIPGTLLYLTR